MSVIPTSVAIVATQATSSIQACTVSSLTSYDVQNPGIMIVLQNNSRTLLEIKNSKLFSANLLNVEQLSLAKLFSSKDRNSDCPRNDLFDFETSQLIPYLRSSQQVAFCTLEEVINLENTSIVLGRVSNSRNLGVGLPLLYFTRNFFSLGRPFT